MTNHARAQRLARGWIVGVVATTVAAVSHSLAGGHHPSALSLGAALIFAGFFGTAVIGLRPSLPRLAVAVSVSQLAFHLVFSLLGSGGGSVSSRTGGPAWVSGMSGMAGMNDASAPIIAMSGQGHMASLSMWVAHAVAASLTVLFLRHAELAVWTMLRRVVGRIATSAAVPDLVAATDEPPRSTPCVRALASRLLGSSLSRRGPPLLSF